MPSDFGFYENAALHPSSSEKAVNASKELKTEEKDAKAEKK